MQHDQFSGNASDIRSEACAWVAQLESGELTRADIDAFREWTQRSPRHAAEIRRVAQLSGSLNVLTNLAGPMKAAAARYGDVVGKGRRSGWSALKGLTAAALAAVLAVAIALLKPFSVAPGSEWPLVLSTGVGEYLEHQLPDGSVIALNTDTRLEVTYTATHRNISLQKGEALFTVAHNPAKPFVVFTGDKSVEALGTVFLVRNDAEAFEVAVTEGRVKLQTVSQQVFTKEEPGHSIVEPEDLAHSLNREPVSGQPAASTRLQEPVVLDAGQHLSLMVQNTAVQPPQPAIEVISPIDIRRKLAWRDGLLDFSDTPLEMVIREVSRHTTTRIEIADPALAEVRFGGVFRAGDTEPLFRALESAYNINAEYIDQDTVRLTRSTLH